MLLNTASDTNNTVLNNLTLLAAQTAQQVLSGLISVDGYASDTTGVDVYAINWLVNWLTNPCVDATTKVQQIQSGKLKRLIKQNVETVDCYLPALLAALHMRPW